MSKQEKWEYNQMMKKGQRSKEEGLNLKTEWNISDPTPMLAVRNMMDEQRQ